MATWCRSAWNAQINTVALYKSGIHDHLNERGERGGGGRISAELHLDLISILINAVSNTTCIYSLSYLVQHRFIN